MKKSYFVSSDIHSYYSEYRLSLSNAGFDENNPNHIIIICGDAFDRGNESKEMLEFLLSLPDDRLILIRGNHEDLLEEMFENGYISSYDVSNKTLKTVCDICEKSKGFAFEHLDECYKILKAKGLFKLFDRTVDYYEIGDYIFVHGWIPTKTYMNEHSQMVNKFNSNWRNADKEDWDSARWTNGMQAFSSNCGVKDKTIVCGHWHSSYGHVRKNNKNLSEKEYYQLEFSESAIFEPFYDTKRKKSIIALDACTAYSRKVNVIKLEINE